MFKKLSRTKVFRDPIYGYIHVDYEIISELIDSKEIQRLRRIRQLSGVSMVFQTAEHSRFTHSLGAYEMANLVLNSVEGINNYFDEYKRVVFLSAALLHDIGHGPYSHAFENILDVSHEQMTVEMILSPFTSINKILEKFDGLAEDIAGVIAHKGKYPLIESLISSQLDVDRMDYLTRDAYFTGATYGIIDRNRILRSMKVINETLVVRESGVNSIESYLMSRYHMYWQVYYHPVARAYELILESIYKRIQDLYNDNISIDASISSFISVIKNSKDIINYINLDDAYVNGFIKQLTKSKDNILNKLSNAFENRKLFKYIDLNIETDVEMIRDLKYKYRNNDILSRYFYFESYVSQAAYLHNNHSVIENINDIKILIQSGDLIPLEEYSPIVKGLIDTSPRKSMRIFYFEE